eukprot:GHVU01060680.1.p1 GENE.GHVU01060680.1~~GHVU01060680.1.p1  ORF type:complete len:465 (+),score=86.85 GHVU01060680.1:519-1913(+)
MNTDYAALSGGESPNAQNHSAATSSFISVDGRPSQEEERPHRNDNDEEAISEFYHDHLSFSGLSRLFDTSPSSLPLAVESLTREAESLTTLTEELLQSDENERWTTATTPKGGGSSCIARTHFSSTTTGGGGDQETATAAAAAAAVAATDETNEVVPTAAAAHHRGGGVGRVGSCINITNAVVGVGILSLPYAFAKSGICTLFICAAMTILYYYTGALIVRCLVACEPLAEAMGVGRQSRDWQWIGRCALGNRGQVAAAAALIGELWTVFICYIALAGANIELLVPGATRLDGIVFSGGLGLLLVYLPHRIISVVSSLANMSTVVAAAALLVSGFALPKKAPASEIRLFDPTGLSTSVGMINFCFVAHGVFPSFYATMKRPSSDFGPALFLAYVFAFFIYGATGLCGYLTYGLALQDPYTGNVSVDRDGNPIPGLRHMQTVVNAAMTLKMEGQFPLFFAPLFQS